MGRYLEPQNFYPGLNTRLESVLSATHYTDSACFLNPNSLVRLSIIFTSFTSQVCTQLAKEHYLYLAICFHEKNWWGRRRQSVLRWYYFPRQQNVLLRPETNRSQCPRYTDTCLQQAHPICCSCGAWRPKQQLLAWQTIDV